MHLIILMSIVVGGDPGVRFTTSAHTTGERISNV